MQPLLVQLGSTDQQEAYIGKYKQTHNLSDLYTTRIEPEKKQIRIDQIRRIKQNLIHTQTKPQLVVVHQFDTATIEAQNAFLKTLEEHDPLVHIVLIVQNIHDVLPTVVSRCRMVQEQGNNQRAPDQTNKEINELLETLIQKHTLHILGSKTLQAKTWHEAHAILDALVLFFRRRLHNKEYQAAIILRSALLYRSYILRNNTNPQMCVDKLLLEIYQSYRP